MRIRVFARRANPAIDKPILRKSIAYGAEQVSEGRADWIDSNDPTQGIIAREMLRLGEKAQPIVQVGTVTLDPGSTLWQFRATGELKSVRVLSPKNANHPSIAAIREGWDWQNGDAQLAASV